MSIKTTTKMAEAKIYDEDGRTRFPDSVREIMDLDDGDTVRYKYENGEMTLQKVE